MARAVAPRRGHAPPIPPGLKHVIVEVAGGFELRTWRGHMLKAFATVEEVRAYYAWHCPADV